jgi:hypothetical protein
MPLLLIAVAQLALSQDATPWRSVGTTDGIQLEVRSVPGASFEEVRATTVSPDGVDQLCAAAFAKGRRKLDGKVKERVILRETDTEHWSYERVGIPVLADRDYVLHVKLEQVAGGGCQIPFETVEDPSRPAVPGVVRIPDVHGRWTVAPGAPGSEGKSLLTCQTYCDPGGKVPAFLAKSGQRDAAIELVKRILARAHEPLGI